MSTELSSPLSPDDIEHFIEHGYVHLKGAIPRQFALDTVERQFASVGWSAHEPASWKWKEERRSFPYQNEWPVKQISPLLYGASCQLLGGVDRLSSPDYHLSDAMAANLSQDEGKAWVAPDERGAWHKDGYFFRHFLDSPEQALLGLICWSDVVSKGGATFFAPQSIGAIARYLAAHPEGVHPNGFPCAGMIRDECPVRLEAVGEAGDIFLMHSYMLHTVAPNPERKLRCISNMVVALREPMDFNRRDTADFSPVERAVLRGLGVERYNFRPTRERLKTPDWSPLPPDPA